MLAEIKARFSCDDCGTEFLIAIDPASQPPEGWSMFDMAEDAICGWLDYEDGHDEDEPGGGGSVEDDRHLCRRCTRKRLAEPSEEKEG